MLWEAPILLTDRRQCLLYVFGCNLTGRLVKTHACIASLLDSILLLRRDNVVGKRQEFFQEISIIYTCKDTVLRMIT